VGIRGTNRSYYLFDGLGSVVALTNAAGSVTNSYAYDPFGVTTETKVLLTNVFNPWRYTGQYQDTTTGLYKIGARYYQPELGRWTQLDPSGLEGNAYLYAGGNPANFTDPSGLFSFGDVAHGALGIVTGVVTAGVVSAAITAAAPPVAPAAGVSGACVGGAVGDSIAMGDVTVEFVVKVCILGQAARLLSKLGISQESVERFVREIIEAFKP
jgi:RHS repeat-associated protein